MSHWTPPDTFVAVELSSGGEVLLSEEESLTIAHWLNEGDQATETMVVTDIFGAITTLRWDYVIRLQNSSPETRLRNAIIDAAHKAELPPDLQT